MHHPGKLNQGRREFVVTWQDTVAEGNLPYHPLPMTVNEESVLPLNLGPIRPSHRVHVIIDFEGTEFPTLSAGERTNVCGHITGPITEFSSGKQVAVTAHTAILYDLTGISTEDPLDLTFTGSGRIHYVNVVIEQ